MALTPADIATVKTYINVYFPALLESENVDFLINDAADTLSPSFFGRHYLKAVAYLTMHNGSIAAQTSSGGSTGDAGGVVVQKTIGPVTIKYSDKSSTKEWAALYGSTKFGLMLISLMKLCSGGGSITVNHAWRLLS